MGVDCNILNGRAISIAEIVLKVLLNLFFLAIILSKSVEASRGPPPKLGIDKELILTREEKVALDKVKLAIKPNLTDDWKQSLFQIDVCVIRWIRANNGDADSTIQNILQLFLFATDQRFDTILTEDWSDMASDFPYHTDAIDKQGRPVGYISFQEGWNVRRGVLQGKAKRLERYFYKMTFDMVVKVGKMNKQDPKVSQAVLLVDLNGFNPFEHSCPACLQTYLKTVRVYAQFMPGFAHEIIVINAVPAWNLVYQMVRPAINQETRKTLKVFDTNKRRWKEYLDSRIDPNQLPWEFGGNKKP